MVRIIEFKCRNCSYSKRANQGHVYAKGDCIVLACLKCKEIINACSDIETGEWKEVIAKKDEKGIHFFCPKHNEELVLYESEDYRKMKGEKKLDLCPKCGKWELERTYRILR